MRRPAFVTFVPWYRGVTSNLATAGIHKGTKVTQQNYYHRGKGAQLAPGLM